MIMDPLPTVKQEKICLVEINEYLTCPLCKGYFIDATTISECLHSFCRSCIIKFLQDNSHCPICEVIINKAKPNIKLDKTLQDIVYKLVPELFIKEMARRQVFYKNHLEAAAKTTPEERGVDTERTIFNPKDAISLCIEYISDDSSPGAITVPEQCNKQEKQGESQMKRFLQCPGNCRIEVLKKFVQNKYNVDINAFYIEILYKRVPLPNHYTLIDIAYIYSWKRNEPMKFYFRITERSSLEKVVKVDHIFVKPPKSMRGHDRNKTKQKEIKTSSTENRINEEQKDEAISTDELKDQIKNSIQKETGKGPVYTNITLNRNRNIEIITKVQKVSNKNGQPIGLNIITKTVKKAKLPINDAKHREIGEKKEERSEKKKKDLKSISPKSKSNHKDYANLDTMRDREKVDSQELEGIHDEMTGNENVSPKSRTNDETRTTIRLANQNRNEKTSINEDSEPELEDACLKIDEDYVEDDKENSQSEKLICPKSKPHSQDSREVQSSNMEENVHKTCAEIPGGSKQIDHYDFEDEIEEAKQQFQGSYRSLQKSPPSSQRPSKRGKYKNLNLERIREREEITENEEEEDEKSKFLKSIELTAKSALETINQNIPNPAKATPPNLPNQGQLFLKITQKRKSASPVKTERPQKKHKRKNSPQKSPMEVARMMESVQRNANDLQSIFSSCKFNIPSSLSITLKESSGDDEQSALKAEPVKNYIEILKIPASLERDNLKAKSAPSLLSVPRVDSPQTYQNMFEESIKSYGESTPVKQNGSQKRNLVMITNKLHKKTKLELEKNCKNSQNGKSLDAVRVTSPKVYKMQRTPYGLLTPPPNMKFQQISAKLHSPRLGMDFTVSVNQNVPTNYGKLDSVFEEFGIKKSPRKEESQKKKNDEKKVDPTSKIDESVNETKEQQIIPTEPKTDGQSRDEPEIVPLSPKFISEQEDCKIRNDQAKDAIANHKNGVKVKEETEDTSESKFPPQSHVNILLNLPKPILHENQVVAAPNLEFQNGTIQESHVQIGQHLIGVVKSPKPAEYVPGRSKKGSKNSPHVVPILPKPPQNPQPSQVGTPMSTNQLLEMYKIQNLAQLSAHLNINPAMSTVPQPAQMALQQAILKQFELQNRQNWHLSQYNQKYLQNSRLLSKEN